MRMIAGAMARTASVGVMKSLINPFGRAMTAAVHAALIAAQLIREYRSSRDTRSERPAPKFCDMIGCAA